MNVAVVGLGKIGVPLAVQFASKGATVTGYDVDADRVALINDGRNPLPGEPRLDERIPGLVAGGRLQATADPRSAVSTADVVVLIVPVDIDANRRPDFTLLDAAVDTVAPQLSRGVLLIVETTVPVGTTRRLAERVREQTGLAPGADFHAAFSPERVSSGRILRDLATYPKIVGGIDAGSTARAADFYRTMLDAAVMELRDAETAEFSKLVETTYRDVNIALANEIARIADRLGVDALQAIEAANSQPYSHVHAPGIGVGGHCIPVYPYFLSGEDAEIVAASRRLNDDMARYAVGRLAGALGSLEGRTVVVLGLAYRPGVKESRHSSALAVASSLAAAGATVYVHDPLYTPDEIRAHGLEPPPTFPCAADALVIQAWHAEYESLDLTLFSGLRAVLDGRAALEPATVASLGFTYVGIGR